MFFERTPLTEIGHSDLLAFGETRNSGMIEGMVRSGIIVRVSYMQDTRSSQTVESCCRQSKSSNQTVHDAVYVRC